MRAARKILSVAAAVSVLVTAAAGAAMADPITTPPLTTIVGVNCPPLFDNSTHSQPLGGAPGTFIHDYDATQPTYPAACFSPVNPETGLSGDEIITKAFNSSDTSCEMVRPGGSDAAIAALNRNQKDGHTIGGQSTIYCVDFAVSARPPNTTTDNVDAFVALDRNGTAWSYPKLSGKTSPQPKSLTLTDLENIYTCKWTNWDQVPGDTHNAPIGVVVPQSGSETRETWLLQLGIPSTTVEPCWQNGTVVVGGNTDVIEENTGLSAGNIAQFTKSQKFPDGQTIAPQDDIFPYSIADWIAQTPASHGVGGHATSIWGHGNLTLGETVNTAGKAEPPTVTNAKKQLVINPAWSAHFDNILYAVTRNGCFVSTNPTGTAVCLPRTTPPPGGTAYPKYEVLGLKALFSPKGWICTSTTAAEDSLSYGFTRLANCGALTAGD
jgi:PBP superfamily domain